MMWPRLLFAVLLVAFLDAHADTAAKPVVDTAAQTIVHLLDYIGVDYPQFIKDGKVVDEVEYKEQTEFAGQVVDLLGKLPDVPQRIELLKQAAALQARIAAKAPGVEVSRLASALRWKMIDAYRLMVAPRNAPDLKRSAVLYEQQCAACHGAQGRGDGPAAKGLHPAPANFHDHARMAQRSLYGLYNTIALGVKGTSMNPYAQLAEEDRWALAFYAGTLGQDAESINKGGELWQANRGKNEIATLRAVATLTGNEVAAKYGAEIAGVFSWLQSHPAALEAGKELPIAYSRRLLVESVAAYRTGNHEEAQRLALAAYLGGFELAEASLDMVDRNLRQKVETQMIAYRDLLRRNGTDEQVASRAGDIDRLLDESAQKLSGEAFSPTTAAVSAFFILMREGLEALLLVAAIMAFLRKAGRREALPWIHAGWIGALVLGGVTWFVAARIIAISGATRELTEGVTALLAAVILLYVGFWLHGKSQAHAWKAFIEQNLGAALRGGTLWALAGVSFIAVYRETFETVLFYQALWQQAGDGGRGAVLAGFAGGVVTLAALAWLILRYSVKLPIGPFFAVCAVLMLALAVIFTGHSVKALQEAGVVMASPAGTIHFSALGVYPTAETLTAQAIVSVIVIAVYLWKHATDKR